jgi:formate/nitrite transporter FocA (FNT family)
MKDQPTNQPDSGAGTAATTSGNASSSGSDDGFSLSGNESDDVEQKRPPRAAVLHEIIRREGEQELKRGVAALGWSSLAAGLSMGFSLLARGLLHAHLGEFPGRFLVENFGYCFGYLVVILARQQLFTENTMTAVLPLMTAPSLRQLGALLRMWGIVLVGNVIGAALFAYGILHLQQFDEATQKAFADIGRELMQNSPMQMFTKGILAGWLIATLVWLLPSVEKNKIAIIVIVTYLIAIGGFTHIIVGTIESLYLVFAGDLSFIDYVLRFALPTLAGNIVGGSFIFALISHAQVRSDSD